ncbi:MAG: hypothetical protein U1F43_34325 [Myxococcota bacterium]
MLATATMMLAMLMGLPAPLLDDPSRGVAAGGVWELGGTYDVAMPIRFLASAASEDANIAVVSDLRGAVAGVRVDSGLGAGARKLDGRRGVWVIGTTVVAAGREVAAFRADVGTPPVEPRSRLPGRPVDAVRGASWRSTRTACGWPRAARCRRRSCASTSRAARRSGRAPPPSRTPGRWSAAPAGARPRAGPIPVRFFDVDGGRELGQWTRRIGGVARPVGQLVTNPAGRALYALDLRPGDGAAWPM